MSGYSEEGFSFFFFLIFIYSNIVAIRSRRISANAQANAVIFPKQYFCGLAFSSRAAFCF